MIKNAHEKYYLRFKALGNKPSEQEILKLLNAIHSGIRSGELTKATCDAELVERMQKALVLTLNSNNYEGSSFDCWRRHFLGEEQLPAVNFNLLLKAPTQKVPAAAPAEMRTVSFQAKAKKLLRSRSLLN